MVEYTLIYDVFEYQFKPYNFDDITIRKKWSDLAGAWQLTKDIGKIEIIGDDFNYLYPKLLADRCKQVDLSVTCAGTEIYYGRFNYYSCEFDLDNCKIMFEPIPVDDLYNLREHFGTEYNLVEQETGYPLPISFRTSTGGLPIPEQISWMLRDVLNFLFDKAGYTWTSSFLTDEPPPIILDLLNPNLKNDVYSQIFWHNRNLYKDIFLGSYDIDKSFELEVSIESLMKLLSENYLNLRWRVKNNNVVEIEHYSFFENGLSYSGILPESLDIANAVGEKWLLDKSKFTLDRSKGAFSEVWTPKWAKEEPDFPRNFAWRYNYGCDPFKEIRKKYETNWETNYDLFTDLGEKCNFIVSCLKEAAQYGHYTIIQEKGFKNNMFVGEVQRVWFRWGRPFIKSDTQQMISTTKMKQGTDIHVPACCFQLNEYKRFKTEIGEGWLHSSEIQLATGIETIKIIYEDETT